MVSHSNLPGPQTVGRKQGLGQQTLVQVQTNQVSRGKEAHHHTQCVKTQVTDGEVTSPPGAHANEKQEVDG